MGGRPEGPTPMGNSVEAWCRSTLMASSRFDLPVEDEKWNSDSDFVS